MLYLRGIIESGFCGRREQHREKGWRSVMDEILFSHNVNLDLLEGQAYRINLCNQYQIPYKDVVKAHMAMQGMVKASEAVKAGKVAAIMGTTSFLGTHISYACFYDPASGIYVEPSYDWVNTGSYMPYYGIVSAYLRMRDMDHDNIAKTVKVRTISMMGDHDETQEWPLQRVEIEKMLHGAVSGLSVPGSQCAECVHADCQFNTPFESMAVEWLKAKQKYEELRERVRGHVAMNGPTQCGAHKVFLKESVRRSAIEKSREALKGVLNAHLSPAEIEECLKFDAAEIVRLVKAGKLPQETLNLFKTYKSHELDTAVSL